MTMAYPRCTQCGCLWLVHEDGEGEPCMTPGCDCPGFEGEEPGILRVTDLPPL